MCGGGVGWDILYTKIGMCQCIYWIYQYPSEGKRIKNLEFTVHQIGKQAASETVRSNLPDRNPYDAAFFCNKWSRFWMGIWFPRELEKKVRQQRWSLPSWKKLTPLYCLQHLILHPPSTGDSLGEFFFLSPQPHHHPHAVPPIPCCLWVYSEKTLNFKKKSFRVAYHLILLFPSVLVFTFIHLSWLLLSPLSEN